MGEHALTVRGVHRTFRADAAPVRALRGVDLTVDRGEFVALMGPSGSGKSTLLGIVAGLEPADEGRVWIVGEELTGLGDADRARLRRQHVGIVFQFFDLLHGVSALDNVALAAAIGGASRRAAIAHARDLLDLLGLLDRADAVPAVLSGGQRQRLTIARALANEPTLLLADEPTGSLDSAGGAAILELFRRLHAGGQTILLVTHSPEVAAGATRIVHLRDGRLVAAGDPATAPS
ncbi:ABC transporter ATP-binding protein [Nitriliruptoraceae bacterium ZYF776]|nr:ABC transporter ATP-binding protein [Profundirhabdus halotolerans]